jgi:hypothetical protein
MSNDNESLTRRRLLKVMAAGAMAAPLTGALLRSGVVSAAEAAHLDEADPTAAALGYKQDTTQVDASKYPQHTADQDCAKCRYFQGKEGEEWAPCALFAGKGSVHANGWCSAYAAK